MKKNLLFSAILFSGLLANAQVTQLNNNKDLDVVYPLTDTKTIITSAIDGSIWVSNGIPAGTIQISPNIKYEGDGAVLNGKLIFRGSTPATGSEIYITDGTSGGTTLLSEIVAGPTGSDPGDFTLFKGYIYFSAITAAEGRELWRTNGAPGGTAIFKDIMPGPNSSNDENKYFLSPTPNYLLFAAQGSTEGVELWVSNGTAGGTNLLKDINDGNSGADSSNPRSFYPLNNMILFFATDATHGEELWKTDGTAGNTTMVKDINATPFASSTGFTYALFPGFNFTLQVFLAFHEYKNKLYFNATDGTSTGQIWTTDGTTGNTTLLKDVIPAAFDPLDPKIPHVFVFGSVNTSSKFIFPVTDAAAINQLWESDGTPGGTKPFMTFTPNDPTQFPLIFVPYSYNLTTGTLSNTLFKGDKFFFISSNSASGYELWISNGTVGGTNIVQDINPGTADGIDPSNSVSYLYTKTNLFFAATDATHGNELWKTDGTSGNTSMVKDIYPNMGDASPTLSLLTGSGTIFFTATDGDDPNHRDLFVVDGTFDALPINLAEFSVSKTSLDALLQWSTSQEINSKEFIVQRSDDALHFENIGTVAAAINSSVRKDYSFSDIGIVNSGKSNVYYRLQLNDQDGKAAYSKVVLLKITPANNWSVRLLSNPVRQNINLLLAGITGDLRLSIKDMSGKTVFTNNYNNTNGHIIINANLRSGAYLLVAENNKERKILQFVR